VELGATAGGRAIVNGARSVVDEDGGWGLVDLLQ